MDSTLLDTLNDDVKPVVNDLFVKDLALNLLKQEPLDFKVKTETDIDIKSSDCSNDNSNEILDFEYVNCCFSNDLSENLQDELVDNKEDPTLTVTEHKYAFEESDLSMAIHNEMLEAVSGPTVIHSNWIQSNVEQDQLQGTVHNGLLIVRDSNLSCAENRINKFFYRDEVQENAHIGFSCGICKLSFLVEEMLTKHMSIHSDAKPVCKRVFSTKDSLKKQTITHAANRPFSCTVCNNSFSCKSLLTSHMYSHTVKSEFPCGICKKSFSNLYNLSKHMLIHKCDKRFYCDVCELRFYRKADLLLHLCEHTEEEPFSCTICKKVFFYKNSLKKHMFTKHMVIWSYSKRAILL